MADPIYLARMLQERDDAARLPGIYVTMDELVAMQSSHSVLDLRGRRKSLTVMSGMHSSAFRGRGIDFDEVRIYTPGDDVRNIDWRVTARTGKPHTKLFREERERPVYLVIDQSQSMFFGTREAFKSVVAARIAAHLAWAARGHGDRVGSFLFSDDQVHELRPKEGKRGIQQFLRLLVQFNQNLDRQPRLQRPQGAFSGAMQGLKRVIRPGSLVFIISDFRHTDEESLQQISVIARHSDVVAVFVYDPMEQQLPPAGHYDFTDGAHHLRLHTGDRELRKLYRLQFVEHQARLRDNLSSIAVPMIDVSTEQDIHEVLRRELGVKGRGKG